MDEDDRPPRIAPFMLDYGRPQAGRQLRVLGRIAVAYTRVATKVGSFVFTVPGFGMMLAALFVGDSPGWGAGAIGATLLIAGAICITTNYYLEFWTAR